MIQCVGELIYYHCSKSASDVEPSRYVLSEVIFLFDNNTKISFQETSFDKINTIELNIESKNIEYVKKIPGKVFAYIQIGKERHLFFTAFQLLQTI